MKYISLLLCACLSFCTSSVEHIPTDSTIHSERNFDYDDVYFDIYEVSGNVNGIPFRYYIDDDYYDFDQIDIEGLQRHDIKVFEYSGFSDLIYFWAVGDDEFLAMVGLDGVVYDVRSWRGIEGIHLGELGSAIYILDRAERDLIEFQYMLDDHDCILHYSTKLSLLC